MKTLTISEATSDLSAWLQQAIAGEEIRIRSGDALVALRPVPEAGGASNGGRLSPREALRALQQEPRLTPAQADAYLNELRAERLAAEERRPA
jgi:antitoxin (DNA-binding transcriptional repressor) of toxin-antitoxin stability system